MRLSVLGMGHMGHALASRLLERGYDVTVWNRTTGKADDLVRRGAVEAITPDESVQGAEVVIMCLTNDAAGGSPAVAPGVQVRLDDVLHGDHDGWWTLKLADKDLGLALKLAQSAGLELPLARAGERLIDRSIDAGYGDKDLGAMMNVLRQKT